MDDNLVLQGVEQQSDGSIKVIVGKEKEEEEATSTAGAAIGGAIAGGALLLSLFCLVWVSTKGFRKGWKGKRCHKCFCKCKCQCFKYCKCC